MGGGREVGGGPGGEWVRMDEMGGGRGVSGAPWSGMGESGREWVGGGMARGGEEWME